MSISLGFIDIELWKGAVPNALISGRVDAVASVVSDKTGYSGVVTSGTVTTVSGNVNGSVNSVTTAVTVSSGTVTTVSGNVNGSVNSVTSAVTVSSGTVTTVSGNVNGSVGSVTTVNDKTGYTLTAGSYAVTTSTQRGDVAINNSSATGSSTISAVTTSKAWLTMLGENHNSTDMIEIYLSDSTHVTADRSGTSGNDTARYEVHETP